MKLLQRIKFWGKRQTTSQNNLLPPPPKCKCGDYHFDYDPNYKHCLTQSRGKIIKAKPVKFTPINQRRGGRVVKAMPKDLRKMKEAQEMVEDDDVSILPE